MRRPHTPHPPATPTSWSAFLLVLCASLLLGGCGVLDRFRGERATVDGSVAESADGGRIASSAQAASRDAESRTKGQREAFTVEVVAPEPQRGYLLRHLELQRYRQLDDLDTTELSRLLGAAEANARELLGTLGYFAPTIALELRQTPEDARAPRQVQITVQPGAATRVAAVNIDIAGALTNDPEGTAQRVAVRDGFGLQPGAAFTQEGWDAAKNAGLRTLQRRRFPTAAIANSRAEVDADTAQAKLGVTYDSGPAYRFGELRVRGAERYDPRGARNLARIPVGADYDQQRLLDAQQRIASSGYYDSVFLSLDTDGADPSAAPVIAQVREAPLQKAVFGIGLSTDGGPRVSVDHTHNRLPAIGWRSVSRIALDAKTQELGSEWTSLPAETGWRWFTGAQLKREQTGDLDVDSLRVRGGRSQQLERIERTVFVQYDAAKNRGANAPDSAAAVTANAGWTGRYFDNPTAPSRGQGLALEGGVGQTLLGERAPLLRAAVRWLGFVPAGRVRAEDGSVRDARIALRSEGGAVVARDTAQIPATLLFATGGDATVRGYGYRRIGTRIQGDRVFAGRYLAVGSVEWQRPIAWRGTMTDFELATFVDAGAVADRVADLKANVGIGVGARWKSPVGPLQADLAYGVQAKRLRAHLRLGFTF